MHISESTRAGYRTAVQSLAAFCERERIQLSFPISPDTLCLWIADRASSLRFTTIRNYLHGINTTHIELGYKSPLSESPLVWKMYKAVKRLQGTDSTSMRLPITVELLNQIEPHFDSMNASHRCIKAAMWLGTCGLLRSGEFVLKTKHSVPLLVKNLTFVTKHGINIRSYDMTSLASASHMLIHLNQSKTDPFRHGTNIVIANRTAIIAVASYLSQRKNMRQDEPLFCENNNKPLTCKTLMRAVHAMLEIAHIPNIAKYKGHSFRKGGATSLHVAGFSDTVIKLMGRWHSFAFARYVDTPLHVLIAAGQRMGMKVSNCV
jgi:hypothetical protein